MSRMNHAVPMDDGSGFNRPLPSLYHYLVLSLLVFAWVSTDAFSQVSPSVFINERHYDDQGQDESAAIEVASPVGPDLRGWHLYLYNGQDQKVYNVRELEGVIADQQHGFGILVFDYTHSGIQNGSRDGIALVDTSR